MSFIKTTPKLTSKKGDNSDKKLALIFAEALKQDYGGRPSPVKAIAKQTDASINTIRKWYSGEKQPCLRHLVMLAKHSPNVLRVLLELIGKDDLLELYQQHLSATEKQSSQEIYSAGFCTINKTALPENIRNLNQRQLWCLLLLERGHKVKADDITTAWKVSLRSAKVDIAGLVTAGLIRFIGSKKTGYYKVC